MSEIAVSTREEVLEDFRQTVVAQLRADGFDVPGDADVPGAHFEALRAWVRIQHRTVPAKPRTVHVSTELRDRPLPEATRTAVAAIEQEIAQGAELTQRLTRLYYKGGFNDFLFNTFGIQHMHLGAPGAALDRTKKHAMAGGEDVVLFLLINSSDAYLLDVLGHGAFDSAEECEHLVRIAIRNWGSAPMATYVLQGVSNVSPGFAEAFQLARSGFTTVFEVEGVVFARGKVFDGKVTNGKRAPGTSFDVVRNTNRILNGITKLVDYVTSHTDTLATFVESTGWARPSAFRLVVESADRIVVLRELGTGLQLRLGPGGHVSCSLVSPAAG